MNLHKHIRLTLIRHGEVDATFKTTCYGRLDVPLSEHGRITSRLFAQKLAATDPPDVLIHSGLMRTKFLAELIAQATRTGKPEIDSRLLERDYGRWQGQTWDDAYASDPDNFHNLIDDPDNYRPPNGETTTEMQNRIVAWYESLGEIQSVSETNEQRMHVVAITHSGPMTALAGAALNLHARDWGNWLPPTLGVLQIASGQTVVQKSVLS